MDKPLDRKEFIAKLGRGGMLASILGVGAAALHGEREVSECFNHNYCDSCWGYDGCALPERKEIPDERA